MYENKLDNSFEYEDDNSYLIPANVNTRFEFVEGFGWKELKLVLIILAIGILIYYLTGLITKTVDNEQVPIINAPIRLIFFIIVPSFSTFVLTKKDPNTQQSFISQINNLKKFNKKQKIYYYRHNS